MFHFPKKGKDVLLVEDNTLTLLVLESEFAKMGFRVDKATDGLAGWNACREKNYDLILIDLQIPLMDGKTLIQKIKKELPHQTGKLLVMSAGLSRSEIDELLQLGYEGYLQKPVTITSKDDYIVLGGQTQ